MNIYDISKMAGVSIATVSRVLNGNTKVSESTRQKVIDIMKQYDYTPNAFARGLGLNSMHTVGILCADSSDPYLASAIYHLEQTLHNEQYDSLLCCTGYELENREKYLNLLLSKKVDSIILVGSNFVEMEKAKNSYIIEAAKTIPIMLINAAIEADNIYSFLCDDKKATFNAVQTLIDSGRKKILYLYNSRSYSGKKKLQGFTQALQVNKLTVSPSYIHYIDGSIKETKEYLTKLYKEGLEFDAVITSDDKIAVSVLKFAKANKISIPEEISIIGYNNSIFASCCDPEISSVDNKLETICNNCISTMMNIFEGKSVPFKSVFFGELVKRETTT